MSNYLRNVAHRAAGASLLRPRVPSRFEPVAGMGPGVVTSMNHFREVVTEREVVAPRPTQATETRVPPPPVLHRAAEPQVRHEDTRATTPTATRHTAEERADIRTKPEIDQPHSLPESHTQNDSAPNVPKTVRSLRPEITQEPADIRIPVSQRVVAENVQPLQKPIRPTVQVDVPVTAPSAAQQFPALKPERREPSARPERRTPVMKTEPQTHNRDFPVTPAAARHAQPAVLQSEIAAPSIHVTIGKVTVQATLPAAPVHAPARTPAHSGPRLTLERYLDRRGGRL